MTPAAGTRIAAVSLLVCAVIFILVSLRDPGYARLRLAAGQPDRSSHRKVATFVVEAAPFSLIELSVNARKAASVYVPWNAREVRFESTPLDAGRNAVVARTTLWYAGSRKTHSAALQVNSPAAVDAGRAHRTNLQRAGLPASRSRNARLLALSVRQQEVAASFEVRLRRGDPAVQALRSGRVDLRDFVDDVFGVPRFNRKRISGLFTGLQPRFAAADDAVEVSADSAYQTLGLEYVPAVFGDIEIANVFSGPTIQLAGSGKADRIADARQWTSDVLRLRIDDYHIVTLDPAPLRTEGATATLEWPFGGGRAPVTVSLALAPFSSVDALRRALNLPVFAFVPHVAARFLAFFHAFVLAVPMFAYLVLSRGRNPRFALVARRLIVIAVAADVFDACISAQPDVDGEILLIAPALSALPSELLNLFVVPAVCGFVLAMLAASVAQLASRTRSAVGLLCAEAARAIVVAAIGFVAIVATGYVGGIVARVPLLYPWLVGLALALGLLAVLASLDWWTIPGRRSQRAGFTIATLAFAAAVAVPLSLVQFGAWATIPEWAGTAFADPLSPLPLAASFLRSLAPLCPLAFGLLLIAGVRPDPAAIGLDRAAFARLVLCCYAVLAGVVVIVPVGFVLAWWTYGLLHKRDSGEPAPADVALVPTPRERGLAAVPLAFAFVLVEVLLLLPSETQHLRELHTPFIVLEAVGFLAVIVTSFVMPAFAFAACSDRLAGPSGLRKGLGIGAWAIACSLPAWFLRSDSLVTAVAVVTVTGVFYAALGRLTPARGASAALSLNAEYGS